MQELPLVLNKAQYFQYKFYFGIHQGQESLLNLPKEIAMLALSAFIVSKNLMIFLRTHGKQYQDIKMSSEMARKSAYPKPLTTSKNTID